MGYETDYRLTVECGQIDEELLAKRLSEVTGYEFDTRLELFAVKWYDYDDNMCSISMEFPNVLFRLEGEGEESDDVWKIWYCNGTASPWFKAIRTFQLDSFEPAKFYEEFSKPYIELPTHKKYKVSDLQLVAAKKTMAILESEIANQKKIIAEYEKERGV